MRKESWLGITLALLAGCTHQPPQRSQPVESSLGVAEVQAETLMHNSGWCWFQDPRAIIHQGKLLIGGVSGYGSGEAAIGVYDLSQRQIEGRVVLAEQFDRDDHNAPALYARPDGRVLAVYARHTVENKHYYRISKRGDPLSWSKQQETLGRDPITYMNLHFLKDENSLYNFYRGIEWNPTYKVSTDQGESWSEEVHFIQSEVAGHQRPYARYASDGKNRVGVSFTDAHPRQYGNSIYYAAFQGGHFYRADGSFIKSLSDEGPLKPSQSELIYQGSGEGYRGHDLSANRSAWISDLAYDKQGYPYIAYTLYLSNSDHRYRLAHWNGERWIDREVAYGGTRLYDLESSYTGLIALDPDNPQHLVISTDVNPVTGEPLAGQHQIFEATLKDSENDSGIHWQQLSHELNQDNIRPLIVADEHYSVILWQKGQYKTYTDYDLDTVGVVRLK